MRTLEEAIVFLEEGRLPHPSLTELTRWLGMCAKERNPRYAISLHNHIRGRGLEASREIGNYLVPMLVSAGRVRDARQVFDMLAHKNAWSVNSMITGYTACGLPQHAFSLFEEMCTINLMQANGHIFVSVLKACAELHDVRKGSEIHAEVARRDLISRALHIGAALINLYVKCRSLAKARQVFDGLVVADVVCCNTLMAGYTEHGRPNESLKHFELMRSRGIVPDANSFVCCLKACSSIRSIVRSQEIHADIHIRGLLESDLEVGNAMVDTYAKLGLLAEAKHVLLMLPARDVVTWTALISGYADSGCPEEALKSFTQMHSKGVTPDVVTLVCVLKACGSACSADKGEQIHAEVERQGLLERNLFVGRSLVDMYVKCGFVSRARQVFDRLPVRDLLSWTPLIAGYAEHGPSEEAVKCFDRMQSEGVCPDAVTYVCCLKACGSAGLGDKGQEIHCEAERQGWVGRNLVLGNSLVDMYAKCGMLSLAREVFSRLQIRDVVSWNALITGYAEHGFGDEAFEHFEQMQLEHVRPNTATFVWSLKACGGVGDMDKFRSIHAEIDRQGMLEAEPAIGSTLVDMYGKCGLISQAQDVFERLPIQDVLTWNALIAGYIKHGRGEQALTCFERMQRRGVSPNEATYVCGLKACGSAGAAGKGLEMHKQIEQRGLLETNLLIGNSLIDMYSKCGTLSRAHDVLEKLPVRDVVSWTALMAGYAQFGESGLVFENFYKMLGEGVKPNIITFLVVLSTCSRTGLYQKSQTYFDAMSAEYGIDPSLEHRNCLVDLLSRVGQLEDAVTLIKEMPICPNIVVWRSVLGACTRAGNVEFAKQAFKHAVGLDEKNAVAYIFLSHISSGLEGEIGKAVAL